MLKISRRWWVFGAIALIAALLITLVVAPANNRQNSGSTYSRHPDGYGAWYAYMQQQGTPIERFSKPFSALPAKNEITLLQVYSSLIPAWQLERDAQTRDWIGQGNTLIVLGISQAVTGADFSTLQDSAAGQVKINTRRRKQDAKKMLLGDNFGAVVWQENIGKGQLIAATTRYLAANAFQESPGNFAFLAQLVTQTGNPLWVDEYLHGYRDKEVIESEIGDSVGSYLVKTPVFPIFVQGLVILLVVIWANKRRFGLSAIALSYPTVNNSEAYIQALAGVLHKADSHQFVIEAIAYSERRHLQAALGLSDAPIEAEALLAAWTQQTGQSAAQLRSLLNLSTSQRPISEAQLQEFLTKWQEIRQQVKPY